MVRDERLQIGDLVKLDLALDLLPELHRQHNLHTLTCFPGSWLACSLIRLDLSKILLRVVFAF